MEYPEELQKNINIIANIWRNDIWEYKFCHTQVKFTRDVQSNYLGDILEMYRKLRTRI